MWNVVDFNFLGPPSCDSGSPLIPGLLDVSSPPSEHDGSQGSSPDQDPTKFGTSPHINRFLAREPPDGCERVHLRGFSEATTVDHEVPTLKPCVTFQLRPSLGSAFYPLRPVRDIDGTVDGVEEEIDGVDVMLPYVPQAQHDIV